MKNANKKTLSVSPNQNVVNRLRDVKTFVGMDSRGLIAGHSFYNDADNQKFVHSIGGVEVAEFHHDNAKAYIDGMVSVIVIA